MPAHESPLATSQHDQQQPRLHDLECKEPGRNENGAPDRDLWELPEQEGTQTGIGDQPDEPNRWHQKAIYEDVGDHEQQRDDSSFEKIPIGILAVEERNETEQN